MKLTKKQLRDICREMDLRRMSRYVAISDKLEIEEISSGDFWIYGRMFYRSTKVRGFVPLPVPPDQTLNLKSYTLNDLLNDVPTECESYDVRLKYSVSGISEPITLGDI